MNSSRVFSKFLLQNVLRPTGTAVSTSTGTGTGTGGNGSSSQLQFARSVVSVSPESSFKKNANAVSGEPNVIKSGFVDVPLLSFKNITVPELIRSQTNSSWANRTAYECSMTGLKYTHSDVLKLGRSFGAALLKTGIKRGDVVGILLPNCPQYSPILLGMLETGIIPSLMSPAYAPDEIAALLVKSQAKGIVTLPNFLPVIRALKTNPVGDGLKCVVCVGEAAEGCHSYNDMIKVDPSGTKFLDSSSIDTGNDAAMILWSSGTSGPAKGVVITHENLCVQMLQILSEGVTLYTKGEDTLLGLVPFFHILGAVVLLNTTLNIGGKVVTMPKFDPALFTKVIKTHKLSIMHLVPPLLGFLAMNPAFTKEDFERLHTIVCGGASTGSHVINAALGKVGHNVFFQEAYGMTEMTGGTHMLHPDTKNNRLGSVGQPFPNTMSKIVDVDTGTALGPNQQGEICIKGPQMMKGYLNDEAATSNTIDSEGWLHTGDIGYYNEEAYFYVVDRLKELIKVKGLQVAPSELEDILRKHPKIADVAIIGVPNERAGELPRAYVVPKDATLTPEEVNDFLKGKVAEYKLLDGGVELVSEIPKSPSGKILRRILQAKYRNQ